MKTLTASALTLLVVLIINTASSAVVLPGQNVFNFPYSFKGILVKANMHNNILIPVVDLPVINITASINENTFREAYYHDGNLVVMGDDLPVINIVAERSNSGKVTGVLYNGNIIAIANLPQINIVGELPVQHMVRVINSGTVNIPVVSLPEIIVTSNEFQSILVPAVQDGNKVMATIQLPVIEIKSYYPQAVAHHYAPHINEHPDSEWFYVTLKNCGIDFTGERICEVISQAKISSSSALYSNIKSLIAR